MQFGISSTEVKTVAEFLLQHSLLDDNPKYEEGYQQAVKDMEELLSEKVMQNMKAMAEELDKINANFLEGEKEKLYTVKFSNEDFGKTYIGIIKTANKIGISTVPINDECSKCYFTKSELEEFKFWNNPAFEFEEVEE